MTLDRDDIRAIAEELAQILAPKLGIRSDLPPEEPVELPGSYAARKREALERAASNREKRQRRARR